MKNELFTFRYFVLILSISFLSLLLSNTIIDSENKQLQAGEKCGCDIKALKEPVWGYKGNRKKAEGLNKQGLINHRNKKYCEAMDKWCKAAMLDKSWWKPHFNIACALALTGNSEKSFEFILSALKRDPATVLQPLLNDNDLKSIRHLPKFNEIIKIYGGRSFIDVFVKFDRAFKRRDAGLFKSLINKKAGLVIKTFTAEGNDTVKQYSYNSINKSFFKQIVDKYYEKKGFEYITYRNEKPGLKELYMMTDYWIEPETTNSSMRSSSYTENYFYFKKIKGKWYLVKINSSFNAGC